VIAGGLMVAAILWQLEDMSVWLTWSFVERVTGLALLIGLGAAAYLATLLLLGVRLKDLKAATE
jgi:putative peptidoglycan lipid II flippase